MLRKRGGSIKDWLSHSPRAAKWFLTPLPSAILDVGERPMFVPPSGRNEKFRDLFALVELKTEIPSLPPEICTQKSYDRWFIGNVIFLAVMALLGLLYYFLKP
jgi:hypothetical protein